MILKTQNAKFLPCDWLVFTGDITDIFDIKLITCALHLRVQTIQAEM